MLTLREQTLLTRLGLTCLVAVFGIGLAAAGAHMWFKYQNRDERPGLTIDDVKAQYSGLHAPSPLLTSLQSGHPESLAADDRATLTAWLSGTRIAEDYESLDLGASSPAEIIATSCLACHAGQSTAPRNALPALNTAELVKKQAVTRKINPAPVNVKANSTHAHAPAMATMSVAIAALLLLTRTSRGFAGLLIAATGFGLLADIAGWWLSEYSDRWAYVIVAGGLAYNLATAFSLLLIFADLWRPGRRSAR